MIKNRSPNWKKCPEEMTLRERIKTEREVKAITLKGQVQHGAVSRGFSQCCSGTCQLQTEAIGYAANRKLESSTTDVQLEEQLLTGSEFFQPWPKGEDRFYLSNKVHRGNSFKNGFHSPWFVRALFFSLMTAGQWVRIWVSSMTASKTQGQLGHRTDSTGQNWAVFVDLTLQKFPYCN